MTEAARRRLRELVAAGAGEPAQVRRAALLKVLDEAAPRLPRPVDLGRLYERLLDELDTDARRRGGCHYTPPELAAEVVRHALDLVPEERLPGLRLLDPAVGGGVFLLAAHQALSWRLADPLPCLHGIDRDPVACNVARRSLAMAANLPVDALDDRIVCADALLDQPFAPGFDVIVGNPPFLGGSFISGAYGADYRRRLVSEVAGGRRGNADLCAYFVLRVLALLREGGVAGLICTHAIAEGDTRRVALDRLVEQATIVRAERSRAWPGDAAGEVSLLWFVKQRPRAGAVLDGRPVARIDARLTAQPLAEPRRLAVHAGRAANGTKIYGQGFILSDAEASELLQDPRHADVIRPYLGGDDLLARAEPGPSRWVICFWDWPLERAARYPALLDVVRQRVKPERDRLAGRNAIGDRRAECWWQFGAFAGELYNGAPGPYLVRVIHTATHEFVVQPAEQVFSHALAVVRRWDDSLFAALQSGWHEAWALAWGSRLGEAPRYTLSRTLETFPPPPAEVGQAEVVRRYERHRAETMLARGEGLTALRRRWSDPGECAADMAQWRALLVELDQAVAAAYGWEELDCRREFRQLGGRWCYGLKPAAAEACVRRLADLNRDQAGR